jgi:ABC-type molybdate transport system substrate-binding protein
MLKLLGRIGVVAAIALTSLGGHAECTTIGDSEEVGFNMAVASNFYLSAQSIAASFLAVGSKNYNIYICEGSSGNLYDEIIPSNTPQYAIFLSADQQRPADLRRLYETLTLDVPYTYANGIPVFLLSPSAYSAVAGDYPAVNYLSTGISGETPPGATAQAAPVPPPAPSLPVIDNNVKLKTAAPGVYVSYLAIGNPGLAPYGDQAAKILGRDNPLPTNNMGQWVTPNNAGTNTSAACSTFGGAYICEYDNINLTLNAISNNAVTAGFVSYGQVCPALTGTLYPPGQYVLFRDYPTIQDGIQLAATSPDGAQAKAADFIAYMFAGAGSGSWNDWLTSHCYDAVLSPAKGGKAAKGDKAGKANKRPAR